MGLQCVADKASLSAMRHVGLQWVSNASLIRQVVSDEACRTPMGLQCVADKASWSPMRHVGLQWVSDNINIF